MEIVRISEAEYAKAKELSKANQNKRIDRRLRVIILRYEGKKLAEIGEMLGLHKASVSNQLVQFRKVGIEEYARQKYTSNYHAMTQEEEEALLQPFVERAEKGQMITIKEIKAAFDAKRGKDTGSKYIYDVLKRHEWRKIKPRPQHPKKASEEEIDSSKKLRRVYWKPAKSVAQTCG